jgi:hypothetical protein
MGLYLGMGDRRDGEDFVQARIKAFWQGILAFLTGRDNRLLSWDEASEKLGTTESAYRETVSVPLDQIVGSVGRYQDFDAAFLPAHDFLERRWRSISRAHYEFVDLPPVELYKVGEVYFCLDGHHRISVARQKGLKYIDAHVTKVNTKVPVGDHLDADELEIKGEYAHFLEQTRLDKLRPDQRIEFTTGGAYERLLTHIALHRNAMSQEQQREITEEEAVCDWYDRVWMPIVRVIREHAILSDFANRTEADLCLWIVDHQHYLRERCGPNVSLERVAEHLAGRHSRHLLRRAVNAAREWIGDTECELVTDAQQKGTEDLVTRID